MIIRRALRRILPRSLALALRREWMVRQIIGERGNVELDVALLPHIIRSTDVCWDIGANGGTYTLRLSRLAKAVVAFEPVSHNLDILERVTRRAGLRNVTTRQVAIGDGDGPARMSIPTEGFYGGYYMAALDECGAVSVSMARIDTLIADGLPEPDFIKCDVECAEDRVIEGARSLIERKHPIWLLETFEDRVLQKMEAFGYAAHIHVGDGRLEHVRTRMASHRNYLLLPGTPGLSSHEVIVGRRNGL